MSKATDVLKVPRKLLENTVKVLRWYAESDSGQGDVTLSPGTTSSREVREALEKLLGGVK